MYISVIENQGLFSELVRTLRCHSNSLAPVTKLPRRKTFGVAIMAVALSLLTELVL